MDVSELIKFSKAPPPRGRSPDPLELDYQRDLTQEDFATLHALDYGELGAKSDPIQKLRHRHHQLAQLLAKGVPQAEAALITGYNQSRISVLKKSPAFVELLAYYEHQRDEIFLDLFERLKVLSFHTIDELLDRLDDSPDDFSIEDLQNLLALAADRTGHGATKNAHITGTLGVITSEHLLRMKEEVARRQNGQVKRLDQKDHGPSLGDIIGPEPLAKEAQVLEPSEEGSGV